MNNLNMNNLRMNNMLMKILRCFLNSINYLKYRKRQSITVIIKVKNPKLLGIKVKRILRNSVNQDLRLKQYLEKVLWGFLSLPQEDPWCNNQLKIAKRILIFYFNQQKDVILLKLTFLMRLNMKKI